MDCSNWLQKLKCDNIEDLLTALKMSVIICDYLIEKKEEEELYLILKKWYNLNRNMIFRCFIKNKTLVAIS